MRTVWKFTKFSSTIFTKVLNLFRESKAQKFYLVKMAKMANENCNFQIFRVNLRTNVLDKSCSGGFGLSETIETCGAFAGVIRFFNV